MVLHRQGLSQRKIARRLGISRNTVKKFLQNPDPKAVYPVRKSLLDGYEGNIHAWLEEDCDYNATWIYDHLVKMGFPGSYEIVKRRVRELKEKKGQIAYLRFETEPGFQAQVDFGEFQVEQVDGIIRKLYLFAMILGYSRKIYAELIETCNLPTFLDCHIRAFDHFGGVPDEILYDRMKNVFIGRITGKDQFNGTFMGVAIHYGFRPGVCPAYAAWVKGKVERPYRFIREGFWRGYGFTDLERANRDLKEWLCQKDERIHGTTHEQVSVRYHRERPHLNGLPPHPFDTSWRIYRNVHKDCMVRFEGNSYRVPHDLVGKQVLLRVKERRMRIFDDDRMIVVYEIPETRGNLIQEQRFYDALKNDLEMNRRKYGGAKRTKGRARQTLSPSKPEFDMDVEVRPLTVYDQATEEGT